MNVSISVVCYKYKPLKNNELPLKIRVSSNRKSKYINLNVSTAEEFWDFKKNQPKANCPNKELIEKIISDKIAKVREKVIQLKAEKKEYTLTQLITEIEQPTINYNVKDFIVKTYKTLYKTDRIGYAQTVKTLYNSLLKFNKHLDIYFSDIDINWLRRYEVWLKEQKCKNNTIGVRFRTFRMIYNLAIDENVVKAEYYPFAKFKVSKLSEKTPSRALKKAEVVKVLNYNREGIGYYKNLALDIFTFSYYMAGINFRDIAYLTSENIQEGHLIYRRQKTGKLISIPLNTSLFEVDRRNKKKKYIFPILSEFHKTKQQQENRLHKVLTKVNKALKEIGEDLGLPIKLTTYVARHSYATVLKREGVPISLISESLGHSSERVTQTYLDNFGKEYMLNVFEKLN